MHLLDETSEGINLLIVNEETLGRLYAVYAACYTEHAAFWSRLSDEEHGHAGWIRMLRQRITNGAVVVHPQRFNSMVYREFYEYLQQCVADARHHPPTFFQALCIAKDIESTIVEKSFFQVFDADNAEIRQVLHALTESTERHFQEIIAIWQAHRPTPQYRPRGV